MHRIIGFIGGIHHFIYNDHKAEGVVAIITGGAVGMVSSYNQDLYKELLIRDVNTLVMGVLTAVVAWIVTNKLKRVFGKKEISSKNE